MHEYPKQKKRKESDLNKKSLRPEFDDARLFCDDCRKFYENICPIHKQIYIPDRKVCVYFEENISSK